MGKEKNFEKRIKDFLTEQNCWFIKYWGGGEFTQAGTPDILCCCEGRFVAIEVKAPNGKPTLLQCKKLKKIDKAFGFSILLYPKDFEAFKNMILCIKASDDRNAGLNYEAILKPVWTEWLNKLEGMED